MKILEKITLIIYSNILLILGVILSLLIFGWLDIVYTGDLLCCGLWIQKVYYQ